jgi:glycosyltransferase domain-containing protein
MNDSVTIVIPTHGRQLSLKRCVAWFSKGRYPIIVADSTLTPWNVPSDLCEHLKYIHVPGGFEVYLKKFRMALNQVKTPFVAFCGDDDFILPSGLDQSVDFLNKNSDYSFCQGYSYLFQEFYNKYILWPMHYDYHDDASPSWLDRVCSPKSTVYYGINRTSVIEQALHFMVESNFLTTVNHAAAIDFALTATVAKYGKFKRLRVPFGIREYSLTPLVLSRGDMLFDPKFPEYNQKLVEHLCSNSAISTIERRRLIDLIVDDFASHALYDFKIPQSKLRDLVAGLPKGIQSFCEVSLRIKNMCQSFLRPGYLPALSVFREAECYKVINHIRASAAQCSYKAENMSL